MIPRLPLLGAVLALAAAPLGAEPAGLATAELRSPAGPGAQGSNLHAGPDGTLHLTWTEAGSREGERALRLSRLAPGATGWSAPRTLVSTPLLLENWADFASLVVGTDGALTAQWFQRAGADAHGYAGWFARSTDGGATWSAPARLGHEFVALAPLSGGRTLAVWLESTRAHPPSAGPRPKRDPNTPRPARDPNEPYAPAMKLLARMIAPDGATLGDWTVDPDVCTCCQNTVAVLPGDRVFVGYRGHTPDEIRDNRYALFADGRWSQPESLHPDGWKIAACPVNGPAADARDNALAVAWFTAAGGGAKVQARRSADGARTFGPTVRVDLGRPMGRIETVLLADHSAVILWMESGTAENEAGIYARRFLADGSLTSPRLVAASTQARASGFPRAALRPDGHVVMSWTHAGPPTQVRTLAFDPRQLADAGARVSLAPARSGPPVAPELCAAPVVAARQP